MPIFAHVSISRDPIRARNRLAAMVLQEPSLAQVTHVLWLDDDQWADDPGIVQRMLDTGEHLIGAPYTGKQHPVQPVPVLLDSRTPQGELLEVRGLGFGFTLTSRACLEKMTATARIYTDHPDARKVGNLFGQLYDQVVIGSDSSDADMLLSEDLSFCKRWRDLGGRVVMYTGPGVVLHAGPHAFSIMDMQNHT